MAAHKESLLSERRADEAALADWADAPEEDADDVGRGSETGGGRRERED
jgi:hypothetical protein